MRQLITTFIAWDLVASLFAACGSGPEKKAEDVASQRVRTTSRVWTAPPDDAAGQVDSREGVSPDQEDWRSTLRSRIQVESRRLVVRPLR